MNWTRVSHRNPCPICNKPDWCTYTDFGVCCMRIESGKPLKNGGWLHLSGGTDFPSHRSRSVVAEYKNKAVSVSSAQDFDQLLKDGTDWNLPELGQELGVDVLSLEDLGTKWLSRYQSYAFPMYSPEGKISGIRLRGKDSKRSVRGSKAGLFLPKVKFNCEYFDRYTPVMICEGPTDTAAALTLGFPAIGRPSCLGCEEMVAETLYRLRSKTAIIVYDNDEAGVRGADRLTTYIKCRTIKFIPPAKDLRSFLVMGGTRQLLESILGNTVSVFH